MNDIKRSYINTDWGYKISTYLPLTNVPCLTLCSKAVALNRWDYPLGGASRQQDGRKKQTKKKQFLLVLLETFVVFGDCNLKACINLQSLCLTSSGCCRESLPLPFSPCCNTHTTKTHTHTHTHTLTKVSLKLKSALPACYFGRFIKDRAKVQTSPTNPHPNYFKTKQKWRDF